MEEFVKKLIDLGTMAGGKIALALVVFIVGCLIIRAVRRRLQNSEKIARLDPGVRTVIRYLANFLLYAVLVIAIIEILGIPMTSVMAILASCGLAVGLSLQGALGNLAGGLMILLFKPFKIGDYIEACDAAGTVREITVFYTILMTLDNKRVNIPNGDLMNSNVTNYTGEAFRRIDLDFKITNDCDQKFVKAVLLAAASETPGVLEEPAPFARLTAVDDDTYIFTVRGWCDSTRYWDVYFDLIEACTTALAENGIDDPEERIAVRLVQEPAQSKE